MSSLAPPHAMLVVNWSSPQRRRPRHPTNDPNGADEQMDAEEGGAALLSLPTREYLQSSPYIPPPPAIPIPAQSRPTSHLHHPQDGISSNGVGNESVRTGSQFYADGHRSSITPSTNHTLSHSQRSSSHYYSGWGDWGELGYGYGGGAGEGRSWDMYTVSHTPTGSLSVSGGAGTGEGEDGPHGGGGGGGGAGKGKEGGDVDTDDSDGEEDGSGGEVNPNAPFIAAMIYAFTRRLMPSVHSYPGASAAGGSGHAHPWSPVHRENAGGMGDDGKSVPKGMVGQQAMGGSGADDRKWGLDECLRFATELRGRRSQISQKHYYQTHRRSRSQSHRRHFHAAKQVPPLDRNQLDIEALNEMRDVGWF